MSACATCIACGYQGPVEDDGPDAVWMNVDMSSDSPVAICMDCGLAEIAQEAEEMSA